MGISHEVLDGQVIIIRMGPDHKTFGDPYTALTIAVPESKTSCYIQSVIGDPGTGHLKQVIQSLKDKGYKHVSWKRFLKDGTVKEVKF